MILTDYFDRVSNDIELLDLMSIDDSLFSQVNFEIKLKKENLSSYDVAIIGISDGQNAINNVGVSKAANVIRPILYSFKKTTGQLKVIDFGNIKGKTLDDKYFVIKEICNTLLKNNIISVLIGGGQDYILPIAKGLVLNIEDLNICIIDNKIDLTSEEFSSKSYITQLRKLFGRKKVELNLLGGQKYFIGKTQNDIFANEQWEVIRLRDLKGEKIKESEPYLRDANLVSFDVGSIQYEVIPSYKNLNVNGFSAMEACQIAWYSGMSNGIKSFSLCEYNPDVDSCEKGAVTFAEIVWHFLEGLSTRNRDQPSEENNAYKIFIVYLHNFNQNIRFYKNRHNNRWWIEVPWKDKKKLISCSETVFLDTQKGDLPNIWWKYFQNGASDF